MKSLLLILVPFLLATAAFAQADPSKPAPSKSDAQKSFETLKTLAGTWEGRVTTHPPTKEIEGTSMKVVLRVTSLGNAILHEMTSPARPDDPITMLYLDDDRLMLTHYCDAGNRPRMVGKLTPDGKKVEFAFLDIAGSTKYGHMHNAVFTPIDENRHTEEWTFMQGDKPVYARFELQRVK